MLNEPIFQVKEALPTTDQFTASVKHGIVEPIEAKASDVKDFLSTNTEHVRIS